ncbi:MAG TPA: lysoplasmalogenase [Bacteroidetes bacterium]|nr:lysoplasmalogenase [Bacteroidota bacterium]
MFTFDLVLTIIFFVAGFLYLALIHRLPFLGDFVLKSIPVLCLAILALLFIPGLTGKLLFAGFLFSAGGDISLSFSGEKFFLAGLGSFLVAHVLYVIAFAQNYLFVVTDLLWIGLWLAFAVGMLVVLFPRLGDMRIPVLVYLSVIFTMVVFATMWQGGRPGILLTGAVLFMLSDAMIAIDRFLKPVSWSKYFIMSTYYAGQCLICFAFVPVEYLHF